MTDTQFLKLKRARIPLKHLRKHIQVEVNCANNQKLFEINGDFPAVVTRVYDQNINIRVGDCIYQINKRNVSRASAKSVRKIIK